MNSKIERSKDKKRKIRFDSFQKILENQPDKKPSKPKSKKLKGVPKIYKKTKNANSKKNTKSPKRINKFSSVLLTKEKIKKSKVVHSDSTQVKKILERNKSKKKKKLKSKSKKTNSRPSKDLLPI
jgi:uncharacterized protein (UPF0210 family)